MYHIKDDKRAKTSAGLIYEGLKKCMREKPFEKITISDIQRESTVGRATFYRNFDGLIDVLYWQCDCSFREMATLFLESKEYQKMKAGMLLCFFDYWTERSEILEQLLTVSRVDIIYDCHLKNSFSITEFYNNVQPLPHVDYEYFMALRSGVLIGMLLVWIKRGKMENPAQLRRILSEQIDFIKKSRFYI